MPSFRATFTILILSASAATGGTDAAVNEAATAALVAGDTARAVEILERLDPDKTRNAEGLATLGALYRSRDTIIDRVRSQEVLERAVQRFPDHPQVLLQLGLTYFSQTFYGDAIRFLEAALRQDPALCAAMHKLGVVHYERWKRVNSHRDDVAMSRGWLKSAVSCDSANVDAAVRYANSLYVLDRKDEALAVSGTFARRFPDRPEFHLMMGTIAYDEERFSAADSSYREALQRMSASQLEAFAGIQTAIGYEEMDEYELASPDDQSALTRSFWVYSDPDPTTALNEEHLEHMYRTHLSDVYFSAAKVHVAYTRPYIHGWETERGSMLIKFGWPLNQSNSLGTGGGGRVQNWTYQWGDELRTFTFVDEWLTGNLRHRRSAGIVFAGYANRVTEFVPEAIYIPGTMDVVAFRSDDMSSAMCLTMQVNADSLLSIVQDGELSEFHVRAAFFDESWQVNGRSTDTLQVWEVGVPQGDRGRLFDVALVYYMPFDRYHVACAFQDGRGMTNAVMRSRVDSRRFAGDWLTLSDILFLRPGEDEGATLERRGRVLRPNPWRLYGSEQNLSVYFEVYGLNVVRRESRYRLTFGIYNAPDESASLWAQIGQFVGDVVGIGDAVPAVSQTFERTGTGYIESEQMAMDIGLLPPGRYELIVAVEDLRSGATAETRKVFEKIDKRDFAQQ